MKSRLCVVGVLENENEFLICRMPGNRGAYPGQWGLPGGGVNKGETIQEALMREINEEVGLEVGEVVRVEFSDDTRFKKLGDGSEEEIYMIFLVFLCPVKTREVVLNDEFEEFAWVSIDEVFEYDLNEPTRATFEKLKSVRVELGKTLSEDLQRLWLENPQGKISKGECCPKCARYNSRDICSHALVIREGKVLMVKRAKSPMSGWWALPAGYLGWDESGGECAVRELREETGVLGKNPRLLGEYSDSERDLDGRQNVGLVYVVDYDGEGKSETPEEVKEVRWFELDKLPDKIGFDHRKMIEDYVERLGEGKL